MPSSPLSRRAFVGAAGALPGLAAAQDAPAHDRLRRLLEVPAPKHQVVVDTDTYNEIDDQYAVA